MKKGDCIENIQDGQNVEGLFLVSEMNRAETRAGKPYLTLQVMDKAGSLTGRVWDNADHWEKECFPGKVVFLKGLAQSYKGAIQLNIVSVNRVTDKDVDFMEFAPATPRNITEMAAELLDIVKSIKDHHVKKLLLHLLKAPEFAEDFFQAPAAKNMHHAYLGGLLEHTLNVFPELHVTLESIVQSECFKVDELPSPTEDERNPPSHSQEQESITV